MPVFRSALLALSALLLVAASPSHAQDWARFKADCVKNLPTSPASVTSSLLEVRHGRASIAELSRHKFQHARAPSETLGQVRSKVRYSISMTHDTYVGAGGSSFCARPRLAVRLAMEQLDLLVAHEVPEGSCGFEEVLAHERRHVEVARQSQQASARRLSGTLSELIRTQVLVASSREALDSQLSQLKGQIRELVEADLKQADQAQLEIDHPEEYERLSRVCDGELRQIGHAYHQHR